MAENDSFTKILLHFNGTDASTTITDNNFGGSAHTWTANGNAQLDTGITKFGTATLLCDGTGDYVSTPDHADFTLGSNDLTVDGWFNVAGGGGAVRRLYGQCNSGLGDVSIRGALTTGDVLQCLISADGTATTSVSSTTTFTTAGWHHFAYVRTGNILRLFINGVQEGGDVAFATSAFDSASVFAVGRSGAVVANNWNGSIDEFRLSVGIARWTANFTPPAAQYIEDVLAGTVPLTFAQTGNLRGSGALIGSTSLTFSQTGSIGSLVNIAGTTSIAFAQSGAIAATGRLIGTTPITFGQSGTLLGSGILLGSTALTFGQSGFLGVMVPISGATTFTFGQSGNLTGAYAQQHFHLYPATRKPGRLAPGISQAGRLAGTTSKAGRLSPETVQ